MPATVANRRLSSEEKTLHRDESNALDAVKKLHHVPLVMAKAKVGAAIDSAIGDAPDKSFGHEGLVSGLKSGEKVPDYLARIYADKGARRRFAVALLEEDSEVRVRTVIEIEDRKEIA